MSATVCRTCPRIIAAHDVRKGIARCLYCRREKPKPRGLALSEVVCASCTSNLTVYDVRSGCRRCVTCRKRDGLSPRVSPKVAPARLVASSAGSWWLGLDRQTLNMEAAKRFPRPDPGDKLKYSPWTVSA